MSNSKKTLASTLSQSTKELLNDQEIGQVAAGSASDTITYHKKSKQTTEGLDVD